MGWQVNELGRILKESIVVQLRSFSWWPCLNSAWATLPTEGNKQVLKINASLHATKPWSYNAETCCVRTEIYDSFYAFFLVGWDLRHQVLRPLLAYCTAPDDRWGWLRSNWWNEDWQGKPKYSEKTCPAPFCPPKIPLDQTRARILRSLHRNKFVCKNCVYIFLLY
jgi:hypothetical protein